MWKLNHILGHVTRLMIEILIQNFIIILYYTFSPPNGGLLSSSCGGQQPEAATESPFGPEGDLARRTDRWTDNSFKGVR